MKNTSTNVISPSDTKEHVIDGYHFKVMSEFTSPQKQEPKKDDSQASTQTQDPVSTESPQNIEADRQVLIEQEAKNAQKILDLMKEKEDIIDKAARAETQLEMKLESQQKEFSANLELAKKEAEQLGYERARTQNELELNELREKFSKSIAKLDEVCANLELFIAKNEKELASAAIEIAQDVIDQELSENSAKIALNLAKKLITELEGAANIELKISPSDYDFVKSNLAENSRLKISLDDAISKGSVVILSDKGNIESDLNNRLDKIKKMAN